MQKPVPLGWNNFVLEPRPRPDERNDHIWFFFTKGLGDGPAGMSLNPRPRNFVEGKWKVGGDSVNRFTLFVGPKDIDLLRRVDPKLQQMIDWGWYGVIAKPLFPSEADPFGELFVQKNGRGEIMEIIG